MGGLLGAGLFGLLSGAGLFGGLSGFAGMLGLLLQIALIGGLVWLGLSLFRRRSQPALAGGPDAGNMMRQSVDRSAADGVARRTAAGTGQAVGRLQIVADDYNQFEALLSKVHNIYGQRDRTALARYVTPEMMGYFADELDENERRGVRSEVSDPKLLQGDLAEAWSEGNSDYATVAMRYAVLDATVEIATGKVIEGSRTEPQDVTELWTFRRATGAGPLTWRLSAIQQPG
jgi:predicted lipid-binding transport protein (Tim44 family)